MALPPTRIYAYISTPERTFARLKEDGLLREDVDEAAFVRTLRAVEEDFHVPAGMVGPNLTDQTAFALSSFLNEAGRELARTPLYSPAGPAVVEATEEARRGWRASVKEIAAGLAGLVVFLGIPTALYLGLLTVLGVLAHPEVRTIHYVLGSALAVVTGTVIAFVGESLIEDVVKFFLLGGGALAVWGGRTTPASAILLGITVGAFMPLLARLTWGRARKGSAKSS